MGGVGRVPCFGFLSSRHVQEQSHCKFTDDSKNTPKVSLVSTRALPSDLSSGAAAVRQSWDIHPATRHSYLPHPWETSATQDFWGTGPVCKTFPSFSCRKMPAQSTSSLQRFFVSDLQYDVLATIASICLVSALIFMCIFFSVHFSCIQFCHFTFLKRSGSFQQGD